MAKRTIKTRVVLAIEVDYDLWRVWNGNESVDHVRAYVRSNARIAAESAVPKELLVGVELVNERPGDW